MEATLAVSETRNAQAHALRLSIDVDGSHEEVVRIGAPRRRYQNIFEAGRAIPMDLVTALK